MEFSDTLAYDADAEAWDRFQVAPSRDALDVPAASAAPTAAVAVAPTLAYDDAFGDAIAEAPAAAIAPTLAYEDAFESNIYAAPTTADLATKNAWAAFDAAGPSGAKPASSTAAAAAAAATIAYDAGIVEAPTLAYNISPARAATHAYDAPIGRVAVGDHSETQAYDTDATTIPEPMLFAPTLAYGSETLVDAQAPTVAYDEGAALCSPPGARVHVSTPAGIEPRSAGRPPQTTSLASTTSAHVPVPAGNSPATRAVNNAAAHVQSASGTALVAERSLQAASAATASKQSPSRASPSPPAATTAAPPASAPQVARESLSASAATGRRRVVGKQTAPGVYPAAPPASSAAAPAPAPAPAPKAKAATAPKQRGRGSTAAAAAPAPARASQPVASGDQPSPGLRRDLGHQLRPTERGCKVKVRGDGWGGGRGEFQATVTEADDFTFTVIRQDGPEQWEETHVLREHCTLLPKAAAEGKRQRT